MFIKSTFAAFSLLTLSSLALTSTADAKSYDIRVTGTVPMSCQASIQPAFVAVSADRYRIGRLNQFCNTGYQMTFRYAGSAANAQFRVRGQSTPVQAGATLVTANGRPVNGAADVYLSGVSQAEAQSIASTLSVSVTPIGL